MKVRELIWMLEGAPKDAEVAVSADESVTPFNIVILAESDEDMPYDQSGDEIVGPDGRFESYPIVVLKGWQF